MPPFAYSPDAPAGLSLPPPGPPPGIGRARRARRARARSSSRRESATARRASASRRRVIATRSRKVTTAIRGSKAQAGRTGSVMADTNRQRCDCRTARRVPDPLHRLDRLSRSRWRSRSGVGLQEMWSSSPARSAGEPVAPPHRMRCACRPNLVTAPAVHGGVDRPPEPHPGTGGANSKAASRSRCSGVRVAMKAASASGEPESAPASGEIVESVGKREPFRFPAGVEPTTTA
jgi:hypothetical protein